MATQAFRLRPTMKQGTAAGIPETWIHYPSVEDARTGAKLMYQNDRVLRVMVVTDSAGSFVEWIEISALPHRLSAVSQGETCPHSRSKSV